MASAAQAAQIQAEITGVREADGGDLACILFSSPKGFPEDEKQAIKKVSKPVSSDLGKCVFKDVKPGRYAMIVAHDANRNRKYDRGFLGIPKEAYGVSLNQHNSFSPPDFEENAFDVKPQEKKKISINMRYP
jgi:uncharacterized protein (DUF2141 family)